MKNKERIKKMLLRRCGKAAAALVCAAALSGCGRETTKPTTKMEQYNAQYLDYFDTVTSVTFYAESEEQFEKYKEITETELRRYHELYDIYNNYDNVSNVKTINDSAGIGPVTVSAELMELLQFGLQQYEATGGRMNIAMGSVLAIWHDYREMGLADPDSAMVPDEAELIRANDYTDISKMQLDTDKMQVYLPDKHMSLDVGAIAKGFATHKLAEKLKAAGATSALLSVGGNVETIGLRGDGKPWRVGIQDPDTSSQEAYLHVMELDDKALVTSGVYQRYYEVDGVRYHHIINPDTLMPWDEYLSVTILAEDGGLADAYSTAVFNMGLDEGQAFIEAHDGIEAMWIRNDGTEIFSTGFRDCMSE